MNVQGKNVGLRIREMLVTKLVVVVWWYYSINIISSNYKIGYDDASGRSCWFNFIQSYYYNSILFNYYFKERGTKHQGLLYRGRPNLDAVLDSLIIKGLADAKNVVFTGGSAGTHLGFMLS